MVSEHIGIPVPKGSMVRESKTLVSGSDGTMKPSTAPLKMPDPKSITEPRVLVQSTQPPQANSRKAVATFIGDGDGVAGKYSDTGEKFSCRLHMVDAPETAKPKGYRGRKEASPDQEFGQASKEWLSNKIMNKEVTVTIVESKENRDFCQVMFEGADVSQQSIEAGMSMVYGKYIKPALRSAAYKAEVEAREKRIGIWSALNEGRMPERPDLFRRRTEK